MPQADERLQAKFPFPPPKVTSGKGYADDAAWTLLEKSGFKNDHYLIQLHRKPTGDEWDAIEYLCDEWDWDYEILYEEAPDA